MVKRKLMMIMLSLLLVFSSLQSAGLVVAESIEHEQQEVEITKIEEENDSEDALEEHQLGEEDLEQERLGKDENELRQVEEEHHIKEVEENADESLPVSALNNVDEEITENILSSVVLKYIDQKGERNDVPQPMPHPSKEVLDLEIQYSWELRDNLPDNHGYRAGATYHFQLPDIFVVFNEVSGDLFDGNGGSVGTYVLDMNRNVTITFNENIENRFNVKGMLQFRTEIREDITGDLEQTVRIEIKDGEVVEIPISFESNVSSTINKRGIPNRSYNAESITWEIDFNKKYETVTNAVVSDPIQAGQKVDRDSIKLYHLHLDLEGNVTRGDMVDSSQYKVVTENGEFDIVFENQIHSAYRLEFETIITNEEGTNYRNEAVFKGDEINDLSATASVTVGRGKALDKNTTGYHGPSQTIMWEIKLNYNEKTLAEAEAVVRDWFTDTHQLVPDSFEVYEVTIDENGNEASTTKVTEGYTFADIFSEGFNGFELQFEGGITKAFKIQYKTVSNDRVFHNQTIANTVEFNGETKKAERHTVQQILSKTHRNVKYNDKTVDWEIVINADEYEMNSLELIDTFENRGLLLEEETITIDGLNKSEYEVKNFDEQGFIIEFNQPVNKKIIVRYTTIFDFEQRKDITDDRFQNHVKLGWIDEDGNSAEKEGSHYFVPDDFTKHNGFKQGSYNAILKEITWTIGVNYNLKEIEQAQVVDYILGNQSLLNGSITVYHGHLQGGTNQLVKGERVDESEYSIDFDIKDGEENPGFKIDFGLIQTPYIIEYRTSLVDRLIEQTYDNNAYLYNANTEITQLTARTSVRDGGTYTKKRAEQNGRMMNWEVEINSGQSAISNVVVTDIPSPNQIILRDSFSLYPTEASEGGHLTISDAPLIEGEDYQLVFLTNEDDEEYFELRFTRSIDRAYILRYQTYVMARDRDYVTNNAQLMAAEENMPTDTSSSERVQVRITSGGGTGSGETGILTVKKTDAEHLLLEGARFALYDETGTIRIRTGVTDKNGELRFTNILHGNYLIKEIEAPDGYLIRKDSVEVTIDKPENEISIINDRLIYEVELVKVDGYDGTVLPGAIFELRGESGNILGTFETNDNGRIIVVDLTPGKYQFIEVSPPQHYENKQKAIEFEIFENQTERLTLEVENELQTGSVQLNKVDEYNDEPLEGATFQLIDDNGNVYKDSLTTNEQGRIVVENLRPGNYQFIEVEPPDHYNLDETPVPFTIIGSQVETLVVEVKNSLIPGSVELIKVDDVTGERIEGSTFKLETTRGTLVLEDLVTDEKGSIVVSNLRPGEYRFIEVEAPDHYVVNNEPLEFVIEKSQKERLEVIFENSLMPGAVRLTKVDDVTGEPLAGAIFKLLDDKDTVVKENLTTNQDGQIVVDGLRPGNYEFVEVKAPEHYVLDEGSIAFEIKHSQKNIVELKKENRLISGAVELVKMDVDTNETLAGAVFRLEDADGEMIIDNLQTDKDGRIVVENLRPGLYHFVEVKAPTNYQIEREPIVFSIEKSQEERLELVVDNQLILGSVVLTKVDQDESAITLQGAVFNLETIEGTVIAQDLVTDENGQISVDSLYPGEYRFVETKAPEHYKLLTEKIEFSIEYSQEEALLLTVGNELISGAVLLQKIDSSTGEPLANASFDLMDDNGTYLERGRKTNENGQIYFAELKPGKYSFVEVEAPTHYHVDSTPIEFEILASQEKMLVVQVDNELILGSLEVIKVDSEDRKALEGAVFSITDVEGDIMYDQLVSDSQGRILVEGLRPGSYMLKETKAPTGYALKEDQLLFEIDYSQEKILQLVIENEKLDTVADSGFVEGEKKEEQSDSGEQFLPVTGDPFIWRMLILGIISLLAGILLVVSRRPRQTIRD